jgi:hypothetical protein
MLDFPTYGSGPFEDVGVETTTPLLIAFVLACAAELAVGLPLELAFWIEFALPVAIALGLARTALVVAAWSSGCRAGISLASRMTVATSEATARCSGSGRAGRRTVTQGRRLLFVSMKEGVWSSVVGGCSRSGSAGGVVVASGAQVSIAPSTAGTVRNGRLAPAAHFQREPSGG